MHDTLITLKEDLVTLVQVVESLKLDVMFLNNRDDTKIHNSIVELKLELEKTNRMLTCTIAHQSLDKRRR